jgi:hypothetical protein
MMDLILGLNSVLEDPDTRRRELYGQAGAIRFKSYGLEYRVLSNYWLAGHTIDIFNRVLWAIRHGLGRSIDPSKRGAEIQKAINTGDKNLAKTLLAEHGLSKT